MTTLQKLLTLSIRWNLLESVYYQAMLFCHQWALYNTLPTTQYGKIGTLFSLIYLAITVFNFGLDSSISPFFATASQSKYAARKLILIPMIIQYGLISLIISLSMMLSMHMYPAFFSVIPTPLAFVFIAIFVTESIKKTVRTILQCAFKNTLTTSIEVATITTYTSAVWALYAFGHTLDLCTIFVPMAITSGASLICLLVVLKRWYRGLSDAINDSTDVPSFTQIAHHRICAYITQLTSIFFSANLLVPLFAYKFGMEYAAILKFISYLNYFIHTIIHKVFGVSLQACFAAIKHESLYIKQQFFEMVTYYLYQLLYAIGIFLAINYQRIYMLNTQHSDHSVHSVGVLFFVCLLIENFLVSYEQLYQVEERYGYVSAINTITVTILGALLYVAAVQNPITFLVFFTALRICAIIALATLAFHLWGMRIKIKPNLTIATYVFSFSLIIHIATYILM